MILNIPGYYYYIKGSAKKLPWKSVEAQNITALTANSVAFRTILAINEHPGPGQPVSPEALYVGPFYLDVDVEGGLKTAITTTRKAVDKLKGNGIRPEDIYVWASGRKGFHIIVPMEVFSAVKGTRKLPRIWGRISAALKLGDGVDTTVYSMGKGRMWRVGGKERTDSGTYKVPISLDELYSMTPETYATVISAPRPEPDYVPGQRSGAANALFLQALSKVEEEVTVHTFIDPESRRALMNEEHHLPPCARMMMHGENIDRSKGFNALSIQFAKAVAAFNPSDYDTLITEFASNNTGDNYDTPDKRKSHCLTAFRIATHNTDYDWSCKTALSVLTKNPCEDCPVAFLCTEEEDEWARKAEEHKGGAEERIKAYLEELPLKGDPEPVPDTLPDVDPSNEEGLLEMKEGYGFMTPQGVVRRATNFTLTILKFYTEYVPELETTRQVAVQANVFIDGKLVGNTMIDEDAWASRSAFLKCFSGIANAGFLGRDDDVQRLRIVLMKNVEESATHVRRTEVFGIHREVVAGQEVFTYVEPGWSVDSMGNENTYTVYGNYDTSAPQLRHVASADFSDKEAVKRYRKVLQSYLTLNEPLQAALMTGWIMTTFLKNHIGSWKNEFPLVNLYGNAESGKTQGAQRWCELTGSDYRSQGDTLNAPNTTHFARWNALRGTETSPVIVDEMNRSKFSSKKDWSQWCELLKDAYQRGVVRRGSLSSSRSGKGSVGAISHSFALCAPVIYCSEQGITDNPAVVSRSLMVGLRPAGLRYNGNAPMEAFEHLIESWDDIQALSKHLYMTALKTSSETVRKWYDEDREHVSLDMGNRGQHAYTVVLMGLRFMGEVFKELGLAEEIESARNVVLDHLTDATQSITQTRSRSEVDIVLDKMSELAAMIVDPDAKEVLKPDVHYKVRDGYLYLDVTLAFTVYRRYMAFIERERPPIDNPRTFVALAQHESHFVANEVMLSDFAEGRGAMQFSLVKMHEKGIEIRSFVP